MKEKKKKLTKKVAKKAAVTAIKKTKTSKSAQKIVPRAAANVAKKNAAKKPGTETVKKAAAKPAGKSFRAGDKVVYPAHGVGLVTALKEEKLDGKAIRVFVIRFDKDRLTLRLPVERAMESGLRGTASNLDLVMKTLKEPRRVRRTMWSRRAQEYESKINSGNPVHIAEVVRDLYRKPEQSEQSYSERQIYQEALERLACEFAVVKGIAQPAATEELEEILLGA